MICLRGRAVSVYEFANQLVINARGDIKHFVFVFDERGWYRACCTTLSQLRKFTSLSNVESKQLWDSGVSYTISSSSVENYIEIVTKQTAIKLFKAIHNACMDYKIDPEAFKMSCR